MKMVLISEPVLFQLWNVIVGFTIIITLLRATGLGYNYVMVKLNSKPSWSMWRKI